MKPAWDKLAKNWNKGDRLKTSLVADVDCTADNAKKLCEDHGVSGYPTIMHGEASSMEKYEGGREYDDLKAFAKENLKPKCGPANIELCDDAKKKEIADLQALKPEELAAQIEAKKAEIKAAEDHFSAEVKKLQETYSELQKKKEAAVAAVKDSGLGLQSSILAIKNKTATAA